MPGGQVKPNIITVFDKKYQMFQYTVRSTAYYDVGCLACDFAEIDYHPTLTPPNHYHYHIHTHTPISINTRSPHTTNALPIPKTHHPGTGFHHPHPVAALNKHQINLHPVLTPSHTPDTPPPHPSPTHPPRNSPRTHHLSLDCIRITRPSPFSPPNPNIHPTIHTPDPSHPKLPYLTRPWTTSTALPTLSHPRTIPRTSTHSPTHPIYPTTTTPLNQFTPKPYRFQPYNPICFCNSTSKA